MHSMNLDLIKGLDVSEPDFLVQLKKTRTETGRILQAQIAQGASLYERISSEQQKIEPEVNSWHALNQELLKSLFVGDLVLKFYTRTIVGPLSITSDNFDVVSFSNLIRERVDRLKTISGLPCFLPDPDLTILPQNFLHPQLQEQAWSRYLNKDYEGAVFEAFKQLEIYLRASAGISQITAATAVPLARLAFKSNDGSTSGPLTDTSLPVAEQEGIAHIAAGAFGAFRNAPGHRSVPIEPDECLDQILLANQLMRYIDRRVASLRTSPTPPST